MTAAAVQAPSDRRDTVWAPGSPAREASMGASIEVGDLITTSPRKGYAMKADDPYKSFGAVIGKALADFPNGHGMLPILVALQ